MNHLLTQREKFSLKIYNGLFNSYPHNIYLGHHFECRDTCLRQNYTYGYPKVYLRFYEISRISGKKKLRAFLLRLNFFPKISNFWYDCIIVCITYNIKIINKGSWFVLLSSHKNVIKTWFA